MPQTSSSTPAFNPPATASTVPAAGFAALGVPAVLVKALTAQGITAPFPIQSATLADTLAGRDVLGRGRTGSGKTLAFALPAVARLAHSAATSPRRPKRPRGLVLAPTRELATQIAAVVQPLADACGLKVTTVFGGVSQGRQATALAGGIDLLIACPGRLEDLIGQGLCQLDSVSITVLDEADHMADLGFLPAVRRLLDATPARGQRMLFSATLDNGVDVLVRRYLSDPLTHSVDSVTSPVTAMTHHVFAVNGPADKAIVVQELASGLGRRLLFTRTKHAAKKLARQLTASGVPAVDLHGNLSQPARERNLAAFSAGEVKVLVATDIAARGIHVDDIELVVHVDPPTEHKAYLHRSGRTARAGAGGVVVTVMLPEQRADVRTLTRQAGISPTHQSVVPESAHVATLVGELAAHVPPSQAPAASAVKPSAASNGAGRRSSRGTSGSGSGSGSRRQAGGAGSGAVGSGKAGSAKPGAARAAAGSGDAPSRRTGYHQSSVVEVSRGGGSRRRSGRR